MVLKSAFKNKWLLNLCTYSRFLDIVQEKLKKLYNKDIDVIRAWNTLFNKEEILENSDLELKWSSFQAIHLGPTKTDIIDAFILFENNKKTNMEVFQYLVNYYPERYKRRFSCFASD